MRSVCALIGIFWSLATSADAARDAIHAVEGAKAEIEKTLATCPNCEADGVADAPKGKCRPSKVPLFQSNEILDIKLSGVFPAPKDSDARSPAVMEFNFKGKNHRLALETMGRGGDRRSVCSFPPIRLVFGKNRTDFAGTILEGLKNEDMKLVVHCGTSALRVTNSKEDNDFVLKEYFAYKALQAAGFIAFNVRLAKISYLQPSGQLQVEAYAFFLEPNKDLATRCGGIAVKEKDVPRQRIDPRLKISQILAERLIDSKDWIVHEGHNIVPLRKGRDVFALVPYDFNDSDLVEALGPSDFLIPKSTAEQIQKLLTSGAFDREGFPSQGMGSHSKEKWRKLVFAELRRIQGTRDNVFRSLKEASFENKAKFEAHFAEYFGAIDEALKAESAAQR